MQRKTAALLILVVALVNTTIGCTRKEEQTSAKQREAVTVAVSPQPVSAAVYVAYDSGFFQRQGLLVTLQPYASGKDSLNAVIGGKADFGTTAETPIMIAGLKGEKFFVIATIAESNKYMKIIARKDKGISTPADLKGKRIGVSSGTNGEFFLHVYLTLNHLAQQDVQTVHKHPASMVDSLVAAEVDAVSTWAPHTTILEEKLGGNALVLHDPDIYAMTWNIAATGECVSRHPQRVEKFLRAVLQASDFINEHPGEARAIVARHIGMDIPMLNRIWDMYEFNTTLDQSLVLSLEDQARWMMGRKVESGKRSPNYMEYLYTAGLKAVQPVAIRIAGE